MSSLITTPTQFAKDYKQPKVNLEVNPRVLLVYKQKSRTKIILNPYYQTVLERTELSEAYSKFSQSIADKANLLISDIENKHTNIKQQVSNEDLYYQINLASHLEPLQDLTNKCRQQMACFKNKLNIFVDRENKLRDILSQLAKFTIVDFEASDKNGNKAQSFYLSIKVSKEMNILRLLETISKYGFLIFNDNLINQNIIKIRISDHFPGKKPGVPINTFSPHISNMFDVNIEL